MVWPVPVPAEHPFVFVDEVPHLGEAVAGGGAAGDDRDGLSFLRPSEQAQRAGQLAGGPARLGGVRAVSLVHGDDVRQLQDASLDPLQLVAGRGDAAALRPGQRS